MHELMGEEPPQPTILLTNATHRMQLLPALYSLELRHAASFLEVSLVPEDVEITSDAYRFAADVIVTRHAGEVPVIAFDPALAEGQTAALKSEWMRQVAPSCPSKSPSKFLFAGQDFGPNNEFVKALQRLARAAELTKHNAKVAWDDVETVVKDPSKLPAKAAEIVGRVGRELGRAGDRVERDVVEPVKKVFKKVFKF
jgi:hypothetical protein